MFCFCYFFSFFNDHLEERDLEKYKIDLHHIFRGARHVGVDVQSGIGFAIGQRTLPWQPILGAKSAEISNTAVHLLHRPAVTSPAAEHHRPLAGTKLYCLVTEAHRCEQLAQGCYAALPRVGFEPATC